MSDAITIRRAELADLAAAAQVYLESDTELDMRLFGRVLREPPRPGSSEHAETIDELQLLFDESPDNVWVAVEDQQVVGMASCAIRERQWLLHNFFLLPHAQGRGIGRRLLEAIHQVGVAAGCDIFSLHATEDPKALTRYLSLGLVPQQPTILLECRAPAFPAIPWDDGLIAQPIDPADEVMMATIGDLDKAVRGCRRPQDLQHWLMTSAQGQFLTQHESSIPAGYFLVANEGSLGRIGPVVALDTGRVATIVTRALALAAELTQPKLPWRIEVPAANTAALPPLFAAGFRPSRLETFFSSVPIGRFDRYVLHDTDYL